MRASYELFAAGQFVLRWLIRPYSFALQTVPAAVALMIAAASTVAGPYDAWQYQSTITINNTLQPTTLTDFPVLVKLTNTRTNNYAGFNAGGSDLRFSMGGVPLSYQIESYNNTGDSYVWVKVPSIAASSNVPITAHWGNSVATAPGFTDTWSNGYGGVWHMNESSGNALDSTTNGNSGTLNGTVTRPVTGQIDGATQTGGTGNFNVAASTSLGIGTGGTLEGWVSLPVWNVATESPILSNLIPFSSNNSLYLSVHPNDSVGLHFRYGGTGQTGNTYVAYAGSNGFANDSLHYVAATWNQSGANTDLKLFVDGVQVGSATASNLQLNIASQQWGLGQPFAGQVNFAGVLDELRISSTARSADWVKAQNLSMNDTYATYGSISQVGPVITPSAGFGLAWTGTDGAYSSNTNAATVPNNLALASNGATAFADSELGGIHTTADLNNGLYGNVNSWISAVGGSSFAGVDLPGTNGWYVSSIAWGRDNGLDTASGDSAGGASGQFSDRSAGLYTLQYTLLDGANAATPDTGNAATGWRTIGTLNYDGNDDTDLDNLFTMYYRHEFDVRLNGSPIFARGIRLISVDGTAIDELEVFGSLVPEPSSALLTLSALALLCYRRGRRSRRRDDSHSSAGL